jgi:hypothetical protein
MVTIDPRLATGSASHLKSGIGIITYGLIDLMSTRFKNLAVQLPV